MAMRERVRSWLLHLMRVPAEPAPPPGDPRRVITFRAAPSYFRYSVVAWLLKQLGALGGLVASYFFFRGVILPRDVVGFSDHMGFFEQFAILAFIAQLPFSFALLRLNFEMRWYILSDRSLRIRHGILAVHEQTMAFANIQNIAIRQNPLQRLFGISSVVVRAAGGGSGTPKEGQHDSHEATFEGVDNGALIRDTIRERIRLHRDAGLGDPDEPAVSDVPSIGSGTVSAIAGEASLRPAIAAARRVLAEASALRGTH